MRTKYWFALLLLTLYMALSGCSSDSSKDAAKDEANSEEKAEEHKAAAKKTDITPICPQVAIVHGLDVVRDYGTDAPDDSNLITAGKLMKIDGDCEYKEAGIDVAYHLSAAAKRGPRLGGKHTSLPIFVAVMDPSGNVLNKNQTTVDMNFSNDEQTAFNDQAFHIFIPLSKADRVKGPYYKVLNGFQLTSAQAEQAKAALQPE